MTKEARAALVATATEIIHRRCGHAPVPPADIESNCVCRTAAAEVVALLPKDNVAVGLVAQLRNLLREWVGGMQKRHGLRERTLKAIDDTKDWEP